MAKEEKMEFDGKIIGVEKTGYNVVLDNGGEIFAYTSGNIKRFKIGLTTGDRVTVDISPYDLTKGRITKRL